MENMPAVNKRDIGTSPRKENGEGNKETFIVGTRKSNNTRIPLTRDNEEASSMMEEENEYMKEKRIMKKLDEIFEKWLNTRGMKAVNRKQAREGDTNMIKKDEKSTWADVMRKGKTNTVNIQGRQTKI